MNTLLNNTSTNTHLPSGILSNNQSSRIGLKHHPQILDRDTEHFKNRMETMLNKFKVDTISEFMEAKRCLLEEQESVISGMKTQFELRLKTSETDV